MATVQITWVDASTNETIFNVYRGDDGAASVTLDAAHKVATLTYSGSATGADWANTKWVNATGALDTQSDFELTAGFGNLDSASAQTYTGTYTDNTSGTFKWAVTAENSIGESAAETSAALAIN